MNVSVIASAREIQYVDLTFKNVVIIDVLRATSVIVTALANKAQYVVPFESVEEAQKYCRENKSDNLILCGERDTTIIDGFHFGNSPLSYTKNNISDKILVQTTSNGTRAIKACHNGHGVFIGSLLNAQAIVNKLFEDKLDTVLVCSGTNNQYSMDDAICAGMIISSLLKQINIEMTDLSWAVKEIYENNSHSIYSYLSKTCYHFKLLKQNGFEEDLHYCIQKNIYNVVPFYSKGVIRDLNNLNTN